jgi:uncharacterized membrane protein
MNLQKDRVVCAVFNLTRSVCMVTPNIFKLSLWTLMLVVMLAAVERAAITRRSVSTASTGTGSIAAVQAISVLALRNKLGNSACWKVMTSWT